MTIAELTARLEGFDQDLRIEFIQTVKDGVIILGVPEYFDHVGGVLVVSSEDTVKRDLRETPAGGHGIGSYCTHGGLHPHRLAV